MTSCSKAPRGLFVLLRVGGVLTAIAVSPSPWSRHCPDRDAFRAGRNLPDKEFRYLRTVIVTAAVHRGFHSSREAFLLTFRHWAGISPYTSSYDFCTDLWFCYPVAWASLLRLQGAPAVQRSPPPAPLLPKVRGQIAEFLNQGSLVRLSLLSQSTCVGLRYGRSLPPVQAFLDCRDSTPSVRSCDLPLRSPLGQRTRHYPRAPYQLGRCSSHRGVYRPVPCPVKRGVAVQDYQPVVHRYSCEAFP